jgi:hypothetical protein
MLLANTLGFHHHSYKKLTYPRIQELSVVPWVISGTGSTPCERVHARSSNVCRVPLRDAA